MNANDFMSQFWFQNQYEPCSPSETALYHYLLFEAEHQQWAMPFRIPTQMVMTYTGISKQGVKDARESLRKRGFITYSKGEGKGRPALYSLVHNDTNELHTQQFRRITASQNVTDSKTQEMTEDVTQQLPSEPTQELSKELTQESTQTDTQDMTQDLSQNLTPGMTPEQTQEATSYMSPKQTQESAQSETRESIQTKARETIQIVRQDMTQEPSQELSQQAPTNNNQTASQKLPLSELRTILLNDKSWHDEMIRQLANNGISIDHTVLTGRIAGFLDWQEGLGVVEREEADCRSHILNSIRKRYLKKQPTQGHTPQLAESIQNATVRDDQPGGEVRQIPQSILGV